MLNLFGGQAPAPATTAPAVTDIVPALSLDADADSAGQQAPQTPDALAAAINAMLPFNATPPAPEARQALDDLLTGLADLKGKLERGEPLAPEFLTQLNDQIDALGDALGIDLGKMVTLEQISALAAAPVPEDASVTAKLSASLALLAEGLLQPQTDAAPETADLGRQVGEKLGALLEALQGDKITGDRLAELGLSADAELDAEADAALAKLLAPAPKPEIPAATVLAKPALQLDEPVLTGKATDAASPATEAELAPGSELAAEQSLSGETDPKDKGDGDSKPSDVRPNAIANVIDSKPDAQAPGQIQQQAARADAVAAPRVVQTGYQTSQQQLNLPQIAFELARQTSEGNTRFQIRLDPAELGRIDVQLEIDKSGQVNARLYVEKAETLDLMQRDQRGLEKALHQAGLDGAKTNLEFSLKHNGGGDTGQQGRQHQGRFASGGQAQVDLTDIPPTINLYRASLTASGVNIIA